jgi:hypothetical protein
MISAVQVGWRETGRVITASAVLSAPRQRDASALARGLIMGDNRITHCELCHLRVQ